MAPAVDEQPQRTRRRRRMTSPAKPPHSGRGRLRGFYFSAAALWGFLTGTGSVLVGLSLVGSPFQPGRLGLVLILGAAGLALLGGLVSSAAYRQAGQRRRR